MNSGSGGGGSGGKATVSEIQINPVVVGLGSTTYRTHTHTQDDISPLNTAEYHTKCVAQDTHHTGTPEPISNARELHSGMSTVSSASERVIGVVVSSRERESFPKTKIIFWCLMLQ